jgi:hypothetical protein
MADDRRPEDSWDPEIMKRMRALAQVPKAELDAIEAKRLRRPSPKKKQRKGD